MLRHHQPPVSDRRGGAVTGWCNPRPKVGPKNIFKDLKLYTFQVKKSKVSFFLSASTGFCHTSEKPVPDQGEGVTGLRVVSGHGGTA